MYKKYRIAFIITLSIALLSASTVFAQDRSKSKTKVTPSLPKLMVGVKAGFSVNEFARVTPFELFYRGGGTYKTEGMQALAFLKYNLNPSTSVDVELGWTRSGAWTGGGGRWRYDLDNIQSNILLGIKIPVLSVYEPRFYIGPSFAYNVHASETFEGYSPITRTYNVRTYTNRTSYFRPMDIGLVLGGEVIFDVKWGYVFVDARYRHGLTNINNVQGTPNFISRGIWANNTLKSAGIALQFGVAFGL